MFRSFRTARLRVGLVAATAATLVVGTALLATNAQAAAGCRVTYTTASQWPGGFTANVDVTNLGDPVNGWTLRWTFPSGQRVTQAWSATVTSSGADVTATNVGYNGAIATNGTVSFGFNGSWTGANTAPTAFTLNGVACTGGVGGTTPPPVQATPLSV
ncbi:cellulose-binding domain-containing protein, partial [Micromonospora chalcea]